MKSPVLEWNEDLDDHDNSQWEANSFYVDDGSPFKWRITQCFTGNRIVFSLADSDAELLEHFDGSYSSLEEAKAEAQRCETEAFQSELKAGRLEEVK